MHPWQRPASYFDNNLWRWRSHDGGRRPVPADAHVFYWLAGDPTVHSVERADELRWPTHTIDGVEIRVTTYCAFVAPQAPVAAGASPGLVPW